MIKASLLRRFWWAIPIMLLLAVIGIQQLRVTGLKSSLSACQAARIADQESYRRAQAEAEAKAIAAKAAQEKEYAQAAQAADADYDALRERYDRILRNQGAGRPASGTTAAAQGGAPAVHEDAAPVPVGTRALPEADWLKLPALQAYADGCYAWGVKLEAATDPN